MPAPICYHVEIELSLISSHEPSNPIGWNLNLSRLTSPHRAENRVLGKEMLTKSHIRLGDMYLNVPWIYKLECL